MRKFALPIVLLISVAVFGLWLFSAHGVSKTMRLVRSFIATEGMTTGMSPADLLPLDDGGYLLVADAIEAAAAIIRTDKDGKPIWRREIAPAEKVDTGAEARYTSLAKLSDGTFIACGQMPRARPSKRAGLLTRFTQDGQIISNTLVYPKNDPGYFSALIQCIPSRDGAILLGGATLFRERKPGEEPGQAQDVFYWLTSIAADGGVRWDSLIPSNIRTSSWGGQGELEIVPHPSGSGFVIKASLEPAQTELLHVDDNGNEVRRRDIPRRTYVLVQPHVPTKEIILITRGMPDLGVWRLDGDFKEIGSFETDSSRAMITKAFLVSDGSIVTIGEKRTWDGVRLSQVLRIDLSRRAAGVLSIENEEVAYVPYAASVLTGDRLAIVMSMIHGAQLKFDIVSFKSHITE